MINMMNDVDKVTISVRQNDICFSHWGHLRSDYIVTDLQYSTYFSLVFIYKTQRNGNTPETLKDLNKVHSKF